MEPNKLELDIPIPENAQIDKLSLSALTKWQTEINTIDANAAAIAAKEKLIILNNTIIEPTQRFSILEIFQPLIKSCYDSLKKHYINQTQPLSSHKINLIELSRKIHEEILIGYKIIIGNIHLNDHSLKKTLLPDTIYRAFQHYNKILDSYYQSYTDYKENIWKEIHAIYKYAVKCDIINHAIKLESSSEQAKITTITPYKQALFIASTSPYEWRQQDQQALYNYGLLWHNYITLKDFNRDELTAKLGKFFVPLNEDLGISSLYANKNFEIDAGIILDLNQLITYINNNLLEPNKTNDNLIDRGALARHSIDKLIKNISMGGQRKQDRFNILGKVLLTFGFSATHYHINKKISFNPETIGTESTNNIEELDLGAEVLDDPSTETEKSFKMDKALYQCNLMNIHGEGAGIIFENIIYPPIQPIEIVAITIPMEGIAEIDQTHWNIGTIKWLKHDKNGKLNAGIEIFASCAIPAAIKFIKEGKPIGYFQRAFLFKDNQNKFNVITPTIKFESHKIVQIYSFYHKELVETTLQEELGSNNNFKCFAVDLKLTSK